MSQGLGWTAAGLDGGPTSVSEAIPGVYNARGLEKFFRMRHNASKTPAGVGLGGVLIPIIGDSFWKGMNQSHAYRNTICARSHSKVGSLKWGMASDRGRGYIGGRAGSTAWPGGSATLSGQGIWIYDSNWTVTSGVAINGLRNTTASGQVRIFMDPSDPDFHEACSDIGIVHGTQSGFGTITYDLKYAATDTGFFTAGTGDLTGTIDCNGATHGGVFTWPSNLQGLTPGDPFILQISRTAGTIAWEGGYFCNGDKTSNIHVMDMSRTGAASSDATFTDADRLAAMITKRCTYAGNVDTMAGLFIIALGINDCNSQTSLSAYQTRLAALAAQINTDSAGRCPVGFWINPCQDEGMYGFPIPYSSYKRAMQEVCDSLPEYTAVLNYDKTIGEPDTAAEVDVFEAVPNRQSTNTVKHPTDEGAEGMSGFFSNVVDMAMAN